MDQDTANQLFEVGGKLLFLNAPSNLEFGIDYNAWTIGPRFKGVKLIPPGLHFIYYSSTSKEGTQGLRTGFFKYFDPSDVVVREWNPAIEDLYDETHIDPAQIERYKINIREFDVNMGPYPLEPASYYQRWQRLTRYITPGLVRRVLPNNGKVSHLPPGEPVHPEQQQTQQQQTLRTPTDENEDEAVPLQRRGRGQALEKEEGMEFTPFDLRQSFPTGASAAQITRWSMDKSWLAQDLLHSVYHDDHRLLLGEFQLAFVCLLMAQNFSGFQHWKQVVHLLCSCHELLEQKPTLFVDFIDVLEDQLEECPIDFFRDILSENNFIASMLKNLHSALPGAGTDLNRRFDQLTRFIEKRFNWEIDTGDDDLEDDEDAPVIVDLDS
ncbi:A1 cistron-splicing factor [Gongronella butleri]|nr:A1 cistron-splicing factor [Gongronella butleri]